MIILRASQLSCYSMLSICLAHLNYQGNSTDNYYVKLVFSFEVNQSINQSGQCLLRQVNQPEKLFTSRV